MSQSRCTTAASTRPWEPSRDDSETSHTSRRHAVNTGIPRSPQIESPQDISRHRRTEDAMQDLELDTITTESELPDSTNVIPRRKPVPNSSASRNGSYQPDLLKPIHDVYSTSLRNPSKDASEDARSVRTEHTYLERRDLGMFDVAALIINKQIGTGIFTAPGLVLGLTGNKTTAIIMWLSGGIWSLLSVLIYVEFGAAFPFNGGELIYLDEVFRRPELLATVLFSAFFVFVPNTNGNAIQFAKHVLLAADPDVTKTEHLDKRLITLIAVVILAAVCFLHYFSRNSGLLLNLVFAAYKIILLSVFIIAACVHSTKDTSARDESWDDQNVARKYRDPLAALVYIVYSYQGWENANYVGGELRVAKSALKYGAFLAVFTTTVLYTLITLSYSLACTFDDLLNKDIGVVSACAPKIFGTGPGIKICVALSALGNLVAVVYTSSKVKQQIARQCILPFYKFFAREDKQFMTPAGALILHFVFAVSWVIATPNTANGYGFIIGLFIYGQLLVGFAMGVAFFLIKRTYEAPDTRTTAANGGVVEWQPVILKNRYLQWIVALVFTGMNLMVIVQGARTRETDGIPVEPARFLWPVVMGSVVVITTLCWGILRIIERKSTNKSPIEIRIVKDGQIVQVPKDEPLLRRAKLEGNSRIVVYELHGKFRDVIFSIEVFFHKLFKLVAR